MGISARLWMMAVSLMALRVWLIARHEAVAVIERLHQRRADIQHIEFEDLFQQRLSKKLFRIHNGNQPVSLNGTFRRLLGDAGCSNAASVWLQVLDTDRPWVPAPSKQP